MSTIDNTEIGRFNTFYDNVGINNSKIGDFVYVNKNTSISRAIVGKFCSIGQNVKIGLGKHPSNFISTHPSMYSTKKQCQIYFADKDYYDELGHVIIGNDVWIGTNAIIMDDVIIGNGAIIAAGAVVTRNVCPYEIVGGVPAKTIRKRFNEDEIKFLENFQWWNNDDEWLRSNFNKFNQSQIFFESFNK